MEREAAPPAPDIEHALPGAQAKLRAHQLELCPLRLLERLRAAREDRARVGHRLTQDEPEELVRDVVVVADRAPVTIAAVPAPAGTQLRRGYSWHRSPRPRANGGRREACLRASVYRGDRVPVEEIEGGIHVVDLDLATDIRPAQPELSGRTQHVAERAGRAEPERWPPGPVRRLHGAAVPQLHTERTVGKHLRERVAQCPCVAHHAHGTGSPASLAACRSGLTRTTSQASPSRSSVRITTADGSSSKRPRPCSADVGNAWWLLCHASPSDSGASHARLRDSSSVVNRRLPKK